MSESSSSKTQASSRADSARIDLPGMLTVEQFLEKLDISLDKPMREGRIDMPESLLKRIPKDPSDMVPQIIFENKTHMLIPLSTDLQLRSKYSTHLNVLRMGRLMEDIDMCAARTAIEHGKQLNDPETGRFPLIVVTALVHRILLRKPILPVDRDIRLTGYVSWVGRSSVEVTLKVEQQHSDELSFVPQSAALPHDGAVKPEPNSVAEVTSESRNAAAAEVTVDRDSNCRWDQVLQARLVMVARNPVTHQSVPFVPIRAKPDDQVGQRALLEGEQRNKQRQLAAQQSLLKTVPNPDETKLVHSLFLHTVDEQRAFGQRTKPDNAVWISETAMKTAMICQIEERNVYNKIFGGFLMRQALEIAWISVRRFACEYPVLIAIDELVFKHPVEIGSMLLLSSLIVYHPPSTTDFVVRVNIEVSSIDAKTHVETCKVTNTAYFIYSILNPEVKLRNVYPETYAESMLYLDGKRHYEAVISEELPTNM